MYNTIEENQIVYFFFLSFFFLEKWIGFILYCIMMKEQASLVQVLS